MPRRLLFILAAALLVSCKPPQQTGPEVQASRRQRDSAVARSRLPGAQGVDRALGVLEASEARAAALDSIR